MNSEQLSSGSVLTTSHGEMLALDQSAKTSELAVDLQVTDSVTRAFSQATIDSQESASTHAHHAVDAYAKTFEAINEFSHNYQEKTQHGSSIHHTATENFTHSSDEVRRDIDRFANTFGLSHNESYGIIAELYHDEKVAADVSAGVSLGPLGAGATGSVSAGHNKIFEKGEHEEQSNATEAMRGWVKEHQVTEHFDSAVTQARSSTASDSHTFMDDSINSIRQLESTAASSVTDEITQTENAIRYEGSASTLGAMELSAKQSMNTAFVNWIQTQENPHTGHQYTVADIDSLCAEASPRRDELIEQYSTFVKVHKGM